MPLAVSTVMPAGGPSTRRPAPASPTRSAHAHAVALYACAPVPPPHAAAQVLAEAVLTLVNAMVKRTEQQLEDSGKILQNILASAADDKGEWYLPLTKDQVRPGGRGCVRLEGGGNQGVGGAGRGVSRGANCNGRG